MNRSLSVLTAAVILFAASSPPAGATGVLDQSQEAQTDLNAVALVGSQILAQTFTAGRNGALDQVDLLLSRYGNPGNLTVEIHAIQAGVPTSGVLASGAVADTSLDGDPYTFEWASVALSPTPVISNGIQYAIVLRDAGGAIFPSDYFVWAIKAENPYASGMTLSSTDAGVSWFPDPGEDFAFKTYVAIAPTAADQCKDDGWQTFGTFKNQGDCVSSLRTQPLFAALAGSGSPLAGGAPEAGAIPGQYIVVLKDGDAAAVATEHKQKYEAEVLVVYKHALRGYAAKLSPSGLAAVGADRRVLYVSADRVLLAASQTLPAGVDRIDGELSSTRSGNGTGSVDVNVAVIDSGIDLDHPDLNVVGGVDCVQGVNGHGFDDDSGHGTAVAGVIAAKDDDIGVVGVAPGARLWAVKVIGNQEWTSLSEIVCGVDWVSATRTDGDPSNDIAVANMSIQGAGSDDGNCGRTVGDPLHEAICNSVALGVPYVVAASNFGSDFQSTLPATYDEVLTVTALRDLDGQPGGLSTGNGICNPPDDVAASFSSFATLASDVRHTVAAPGVCIESTALGGGYLQGFGGTSFAAPYLTGIVALCRANGTCKGSPQDVTKKIRNNATDYNQANPDYGFLGDPLRPVTGKYYGYLVRAALY